MVLGISLYKMGVFTETYPRKNLILMAVIGLTIGGFLHSWLHLQFYNHFTDHLTSVYYLIFFDLGRLPMVVGYIGLIILLFRLKLFALPGRWLQSVGKMALSNYLFQSTLAATIFQSGESSRTRAHGSRKLGDSNFPQRPLDEILYLWSRRMALAFPDLLEIAEIQKNRRLKRFTNLISQHLLTAHLP